MWVTVAWETYGPDQSHPVEPEPAPIVITPITGTSNKVTVPSSQPVTYHWDTDTDEEVDDTEQVVSYRVGQTGSNVHPGSNNSGTTIEGPEGISIPVDPDAPCDRYCVRLLHICHSNGSTIVWNEHGIPTSG